MSSEPQHHELRRLLAYWTSKKGDREFPARPDIEPLELRELLPHLFIIEVQGEQPKFRFRLSGTEVDRLMGQSLTGKMLDDIAAHDIAQLARQHYREAVIARRPIRHRIDHLVPEGKYWHYERLILPLSSDGRTVNMLLCGVYEV